MRKKELLRIIDANLNRLREALRVCEEVTRFILNDKRYTEKIKRIRHSVFTAIRKSSKLDYSSLVSSRDSKRDIGKHTISNELKRGGWVDILSANMQRAKESLRVLEEFSKVLDADASLRFKRIRFSVYSLEKVLLERFGSSINTGQRSRNR